MRCQRLALVAERHHIGIGLDRTLRRANADDLVAGHVDPDDRFPGPELGAVGDAMSGKSRGEFVAVARLVGGAIDAARDLFADMV